MLKKNRTTSGSANRLDQRAERNAKHEGHDGIIGKMKPQGDYSVVMVMACRRLVEASAATRTKERKPIERQTTAPRPECRSNILEKSIIRNLVPYYSVGVSLPRMSGVHTSSSVISPDTVDFLKLLCI